MGQFAQSWAAKWFFFFLSGAIAVYVLRGLEILTFFPGFVILGLVLLAIFAGLLAALENLR
ncbi:MAG: hypothetical protein HC851_14075 [Acaryochloris sp. RU_4_1]|nr:hypothetical protein [Acaryochloris sp. RU_4_1]NJN37840.1 hypothetical protein [Acaryochloridaceae cyanobacterium CSU_3_4]NJR55519.1 hypothetical protein [Acaryochloris sp. CRU_2_0]